MTLHRALGGPTSPLALIAFLFTLTPAYAGDPAPTSVPTFTPPLTTETTAAMTPTSEPATEPVDPTPIPTANPPAPTPLPPGDTTEQVHLKLTEEELQCLPEAMQRDGTNVMPSGPDSPKTLIDCLSDSSLNHLFLIEGLQQQNDLQDETAACLGQNPLGPTMRAMLLKTESPDAQFGLIILIIGATMAMADCLTDQK